MNAHTHTGTHHNTCIPHGLPVIYLSHHHFRTWINSNQLTVHITYLHCTQAMITHTYSTYTCSQSDTADSVLLHLNLFPLTLNHQHAYWIHPRSPLPSLRLLISLCSGLSPTIYVCLPSLQVCISISLLCSLQFKGALLPWKFQEQYCQNIKKQFVHIFGQ